MVTFNSALEVLSGNFDVTPAVTGDGCVVKTSNGDISLTSAEACQAAVALKNLTKTLSGNVAGTGQFKGLKDFKNSVPDAISHTALAIKPIQLACEFLRMCTRTGIEKLAADARAQINANTANVKRGQ
jgi:hypothetical protein